MQARWQIKHGGQAKNIRDEVDGNVDDESKLTVIQEEEEMVVVEKEEICPTNTT